MDKEREPKQFYPDYIFEVLLTMLITLEVLAIFALIFPPPTGRRIDLLGQYQPLPEWYFLWLYQLIWYFPGRLAVVGTVLIPIAGFVLMAAVPFIDRNPDSGRRRLVSILMAFMLAGVCLLTALAVI